jgi:lysosomal alpha-mannosidase
VQEVHQKYSEWVSQVIRLYADSEYVEYEWMIGSIPMEYIINIIVPAHKIFL